MPRLDWETFETFIDDADQLLTEPHRLFKGGEDTGLVMMSVEDFEDLKQRTES